MINPVATGTATAPQAAAGFDAALNRAQAQATPAANPLSDPAAQKAISAIAGTIFNGAPQAMQKIGKDG